ncbi:MAG TPA: transcription antitermination factor NusB [Gemmatimonadales bacterium]|nr:transcription antitermination factor NusB [Gemmatimonadales bacterium]
MAIRPETRSRALALQLLYAWDQMADQAADPRTAWARVLPLVKTSPAVRDRAVGLAEAVVGARARLDPALERAADRWRLERVAVVDRNLLRLAALELEGGVTPPKVVIDEAVRLARWFGGPKSPGFVNGILDRLARDLGRL